MSKEKIIKLLPLLSLIVATLILLISVLLYNIALVKENVSGFILLSIVIITQAFNQKIGYQATCVLLLIGTFAFARFTPYMITFSLSIVKIDVFCFCILLLYIIVHRDQLIDWIIEFRYGNNQPEK